MSTLIYRKQSAHEDKTTNPAVAWAWYHQGEIVEVLDNNKIINVWFKEEK